MTLVSKMIYKYSELLKKEIYTSDADIKKVITNGKLFKSVSLIEGKTGKENISSLTESDIRKLLAYNA